MISINTIIFILVLTIINLVNAENLKQKWDYNQNNPNSWAFLEGEQFSSCGSSKQSPINIIPTHVKCDWSIVKPLQVSGYDSSYNFNFSNTQLTIKATLEDEKANMLLNGSGIPKFLSPFKLVQFHFHWGQHDYEGSEHMINYKHAPLELHLVHSSTKDPNYFAVIGILFEVSESSNPYFDSIADAAAYLANHPNSTYKADVNLMRLLPQNKDSFYFYEGSLTTPPCTERVFWTVMAQKVPISSAQLDKIQLNPVKSNFRPPQPLNERDVLTRDCELDGLLNSVGYMFSKQFFYKLLIFEIIIVIFY